MIDPTIAKPTEPRHRNSRAPNATRSSKIDSRLPHVSIYHRSSLSGSLLSKYARTLFLSLILDGVGGLIHGRAYNISAYLRVASLAVSLYDYLENAPAAWRFYKDQFRSRRLTHSSVLFVLLRFTSIAVLVLSNVGFFYGGFTAASCQLFFLLPPSFKVIQGMVSQAILGIRAFNLSRRSRKIGWVLIVLYFTSCVLQWVTTLSQRSAVRDEIYVTAVHSTKSNQLGAWIYYAIAIIYDLSITAISVIFLLKYQLTPTSSVVSQVTKMMLYDGLGYFFVLTAVNILNLIMYRTSHDVQNAAYGVFTNL
ncbi:hypothetical protein BD779DRAFT_961829 [Infundibulicybe gibba]|nr:hypothetical protein BD779DRAFT_961829 [Infundibulicybe gibba]